MYTDKNVSTWYGKLSAKNKDIIVIYDNRVIASKGRVSFYHTGRKEIVEFVEDIVKKNLHDLTDEELKEAEKEYKKEWNAAFTEYKKQHPALFPTKKSAAPAPETNTFDDVEIDEDDDEDADMINIDDLESEDDFDEEEEEV
jgi:hypothetical protein